MQKLLNLSAVALLAVLSLGSCKKDKEDQITIVNRATEELTFDVYSSMDAYATGQSPMLRKVLPASDKLLLPTSTLPAGSTYYVDWYNENNTLHNWSNDEYPNTLTTVAFAPKTGSNTYYTSGDTRNPAKNVFLNGNSEGTSWVAIDAFQYSQSTGFVSVWAQVPDSERYHTVAVTKKFTATHQYKAADGSFKVHSMVFKVHNTSQGYIEFHDAAGSNLGYMITGRLPSGKAPDYASNSTDSLLAMLPNSELQFLMVKQK
jgi:hypothetical protein